METLQKLETRVRTLLQDRLNARERVLDRDPALLGKTNDQGSATVPGMPGYCYVRVGKDATQSIVFNDKTEHTNGLAVIVGYDAAQPQLFQVLTTRNPYDYSVTPSPGTGPHATSHTWGVGSDVAYLRHRQIVDGFVYPTSPASMEVNVRDVLYGIGQSIEYYAGGTLDLTSSVPGSNRRWVLIAFDEDGPYTVDGSILSLPGYSDIPQATSPTHWRVAAVLLESSTTSITDWPNTQMIADLRLAETRSSAPGGGYFSLANVIVVAESGGDYTAIQDAHDVAVAGDTIWAMPASYAENIAWTTANLALVGLDYRKFSGPYGAYLAGADDTGPILDVDAGGLFVNLVLNRSLAGGSGTFIGLDAGENYNAWLADSRIDLSAGATGRAVTAVRIGSSSESAIDRCFIRAADGSTNLAVEILAGADVVRIKGSELYGDVVALGACELHLHDCVVNGDLTGATGADLYLYNCHVTGTISGWDSATVQGLVPDHDHTGDLGDGGDLDIEFFAVQLFSGDVTMFDADDSGLAAAIAAAVSGDTIIVPPATFTSDYVLPAGVTLAGRVAKDTIFSGEIMLDDGSCLEMLSVIRSKNDALDYYGVIGPDTGEATMRDCWVSVTQAGAGDAWGLRTHNRNGDLVVFGGYVFGSTADAWTN